MLLLAKKAAPEWQRRDREVFESAATLENIIKNMASFFELQRTDVKKHKEAKTKKAKQNKKDKTTAAIVMFWLRDTKI